MMIDDPLHVDELVDQTPNRLRRKGCPTSDNALYARLATLFRLHQSPNSQRDRPDVAIDLNGGNVVCKHFPDVVRVFGRWIL
jgi:hypothetical protein